METSRTSPRYACRASAVGLLALALSCALRFSVIQSAMAAPVSNSAPSITGRLTDATGHSLVGITVVYFGQNNSQGFGQTTTNSNGRYSFAGLNGSYSISPRIPDAAFLPPARNVTVTPGNARSADFVGYHTPYIIGRVTTAPTGSGSDQGVPGVTVRRVDRSGRVSSTVTDTGGYYGFGLVPLGQHSLTLSKAGAAFLPPAQNVTLGVGAKGITVNFSALQGAYLSGRVAQRDGTGVGRLGIVLQNSDGPVRVTLTDAQGYYGFSEVGAGNYTVIARGPNYNLLPPARNLTTDGKTGVTHIDFTALASPFISGRITTPAGSGLQSVIVTLRQQSSSNSSTVTAVVNSDAGGYYGFSHVSSGTYVITPSLSGYTFRPPLQSVTINETEANPRVSYPNLDFLALSSTTKPTSPVTLSTTQVNANTASIQLRFSGALDTVTASDPTHFTVTIEEHPIAVQSASYNMTTHTVTLIVAAPSLASNTPVVVKWNGLLDVNQLPVIGSR